MGKLLVWVDKRFPLSSLWNEHLARYYAPKNFNFWYFFGSLALLMLVIQFVSGIFLTMNYKPSSTAAFASVEYIMRDVNLGWLVRYMHSTGASAFFVVIYLHMFRAMLYGSYKKPRELLWVIGMFIYLLLMAEAFFGYLLPWGQMSYWGAQVILNLASAVPFIGEDLAVLVRGDYNISDVTLNRFFALHVVAIPLILVGVVWAHLMSLHHTGSNNPDGIEIKDNKNEQGVPVDGVPFHPYYTVKDLFGAIIFLIVFAWVLFFNPEMGGYFLEAANFEAANPLKTPEHIAPVWYFTPFYSILRAVPDKLMGVVAMKLAVFFLFLLPWLDRSPVRSIRYRGWMYRTALTTFVVSFLALGWLGTKGINPAYTLWSQILSVLYFSFFIFMPLYTKYDNDKPEPQRLTT
ncbi:MAG: cytochrome b [Candidatus Porifericomitaceae bacterium WSBS_2022_MAG_OTU9]